MASGFFHHVIEEGPLGRVRLKARGNQLVKGRGKGGGGGGGGGGGRGRGKGEGRGIASREGVAGA